MTALRWRKQSYLKQRLQKSVWKECSDCSLCTDLAKGPSRLGVQSGGSFTGLGGSKRSLYLWRYRFVTVNNMVPVQFFCNTMSTLWSCSCVAVDVKLFQMLIKCSFESGSLRGSHHYYFPPWQLASPWWTLSNGLFSTVHIDPHFQHAILTFPSAPPSCPCKGTSRRWL